MAKVMRELALWVISKRSPRSAKSAVLIRDFNHSLKKRILTQAFYQMQLQGVAEGNQSEFTRYFNQVFQNNYPL